MLNFEHHGLVDETMHLRGWIVLVVEVRVQRFRALCGECEPDCEIEAEGECKVRGFEFRA